MLVPAWIITPPMSVNKNKKILMECLTEKAMAPPSKSGIKEAVNESGRTASFHARALDFTSSHVLKDSLF